MCFRSIVAQRQGWDEVWTLAIETWPLCSRHAVAALSLTDSGSTNSGGLASDRQKGFFKPFSFALMILSVTYLLSNDHTHCLFFFISKFLGGSSWKVLFKFGRGYACLSVPVSCFVYGMSEAIVFTEGHQRQILPRADSLSILWAAACVFAVIRQEIDFSVHLVCPSLCVSKLNLERPMMHWHVHCELPC